MIEIGFMVAKRSFHMQFCFLHTFEDVSQYVFNIVRRATNETIRTVV